MKGTFHKEYSVIIAAKDAESTIYKSIESVLAQTILPAEIIVVNDRSKDQTAEIAKKFPLVKVIDGEGIGSGPARNLGISKAKSDYVAFLDSDDIWHPKKMATQLPIVSSKYENLVGAYANYFCTLTDRVIGRSIRTKNDDEATLHIKNGASLPALLSTWVVNKSLFDKYGFFDVDFLRAQDFELANRFARNGVEFNVVRLPLIDYRISSSSETARHYRDQFFCASYVRKFSHLENKPELRKWVSQIKPISKLSFQATSGYFVRKAMCNRSGERLKSTLFLFFAFCFAPIKFSKKALKQGRINF